MKKYLYLIKNAKIPTYLKYWLMYSSKKISLLIQSLPITLENTIKDLKIIINKIYGNTIQDGEPTPENPVPVENITGDVEVKVQNGNLFNKDMIPTGIWQATKEIYQNGLKLTSTATGGVCYAQYDFAYSASQIQNLYFSFLKTGKGWVNVYFYDENGTSVVTYPNQQSSFLISNVPTTAVTCRIFFYGSTANVGNITIFDNIQLNTGTTAGEYIPHQEQNYPISLGDIELCKIGDYQDYIYKENGNWYKYGAIGKVVLDGSEDWTMGITSRFILNIGKLSSSNTGYCDLFKNQALGQTTGITFLINTQNIYIQYNEKTNVTDFTTWLSTHNTTVYYVLATPTTTQITDTTLINQLNALEQAHTYEDVTNISSNQNIYLDIDYIKRG